MNLRLKFLYQKLIPNIIRIVDHSDPNDEFQFYVMESVEGAKSLKQIINSDDNPYYANPQKSLQLFIQILEAMYAWSEANIVHRDLSLGNILVSLDGSIKVIDFGICQIDEQDTITLIDEGVGTQNYMAPECESGAVGKVSVVSDLYSAGKILWSAVTGMNVFSRETSVFNQKSLVKILPNNPETWHLQKIFEKTIRQNPQDRCESAENALNLARRILFLVISGYPPLEKIHQNCPTCGFGQLTGASGLHMVFGNPNPQGIYSLKCDYCGFCFAVDKQLHKQNIEERRLLS